MVYYSLRYDQNSWRTEPKTVVKNRWLQNFEVNFLVILLIDIKKFLYQEKALRELYPMVISSLMDGLYVRNSWVSKLRVQKVF